MFLASLYSLHCSLCGFLKVVAGPGAGKSRVLSSRLAHLLISKRCEPHQILVLSFNHYAAKSLRVKAEKMLANTMNSLNTVKATVSSSEVYCDSFHGFCSVVLKNHGHLLNLGNDLNIADEYEQLKIMTSLLRSRGYKSSNAAMATNLLRRIRFWKESGLGYLGIQREILESWTEKRAYEIYPAYQNELRSRSALDFGDLLLFTLRLFRENPQTLEIYRDKYSHILVDEFQDISPAQYDILRILVVGFLDNTTPFSSSHGRTYVRSETQFNALNGEQLRRSEEYVRKAFSSGSIYNAASFRGNQMNYFRFENPVALNVADVTYSSIDRQFHRIVNVFCAGDDDQSIYGFRGSHIELMRRFRFDFPDAKVLKFDTSYRMPGSLCQMTKSVVDPLPDRISKTLNYDIKTIETGPSLEIKKMSDERCELEWISSYVQNETKGTNFIF